MILPAGSFSNTVGVKVCSPAHSVWTKQPQEKRGHNNFSWEQDCTADGENQMSKGDHAKKLCHRVNEI